jgi:hypothetical protein
LWNTSPHHAKIVLYPWTIDKTKSVGYSPPILFKIMRLTAWFITEYFKKFLFCQQVGSHLVYCPFLTGQKTVDKECKVNNEFTLSVNILHSSFLLYSGVHNFVHHCSIATKCVPLNQTKYNAIVNCNFETFCRLIFNFQPVPPSLSLRKATGSWRYSPTST